MKKDKRFKKYEFSNENQANDLIEKLENEALGLVRLGHFVVTPEIVDEDGKVVQKEVKQKNYCVDVFWRTEEPEEWKVKKIQLKGARGSHDFAGYTYADDDEFEEEVEETDEN